MKTMQVNEEKNSSSNTSGLGKTETVSVASAVCNVCGSHEGSADHDPKFPDAHEFVTSECPKQDS